MKFCLLVLWTMAIAGTGVVGAQTKPIPRTPDGKPDFSGYFNLQYTPNMAMGKEDTVPYTPAGKAAYASHDAKEDPDVELLAARCAAHHAISISDAVRADARVPGDPV